MQKIYLIVASLLALLANGLGAFGTHALRGTIEPSYLAAFQTGVQYQFYHSLALFMLALLMFHIKNTWLTLAGIGFITGCFFFSGSLFVLSISGFKWLGIITPLGGMAFIMGWIFLLIGVIKS
ncbi:MAG: DUF423 domain-containing protein [Legionella sp.]|nr:DUF423 domain-containing protein [Legionella sp.]